MTSRLVLVAMLLAVPALWAQEGRPAAPNPGDAGPILVPRNSQAPRSEQDEDGKVFSSSKQTKIDIETPGTGPGSTASRDVNELRPFDPHQADKDMEVAAYYFKQKNYCGALDRFYSALYYDSHFAEAAFRLAETYEKLGDFADARKHYQQYLDIWARGPLAADAQKKLADLKQAPDGHLPECGLLPPDATAGGAEEKPTPAGTDLTPPK